MFSHSRINTFKRCPKLYEYQYIQHLQSLEDSAPLNIGKALHYGIEHSSSEKALEYMNQQDYFLTEKGETEIVLVLGMVDAYLLKFGTAEKIQHEVEFNLKLFENSEENDFHGFIDGVIEEDDGYYLLEIKTASQVDNGYIKKLEFNDQISRYWYALEQTLDKPLLGVKYRIIKKPAIRQKIGESVSEFRQRLIERLQQDDSMFEFILKRTPEQIIDCIEDTKQDITTIKQSRRFPKSLGACSQYGTCPFIELCCGTEDAIYLFKKKEGFEDEELSQD